jgi:hypothetical protein
LHVLKSRNPKQFGEEDMQMRKFKVVEIFISAFLIALGMIACSDPDNTAGSGNPNAPLTVPIVSGETPIPGSTLICPNTAVITATFSKSMNPATINVNTFTLSSNAGNVAGTVAYVSGTNVATFTPSAALIVSTLYTATITTGVNDTFGNHLAANVVWTFTTSVACPLPSSSLGSACTFGILGATPAVANTGFTVVSGDIGIWPAASITGFPPGTFSGTEHLGDSVAMTAQGDLTIAYNNAAAAAGGAVLPADIGGMTLAAGVYKTTSAQPSLGITGNLTFDGGGNPNAIWVIQIMSTLTTAAGNSQIILINGASAHNITWVVGSSATLGTNTIFQGTIMAEASITLTTGATLNGRALARTGAVTLDSNPVNVPPCP